ncbi:hypothetical protein PoB_000164700 [Plakobranchus ocellatus]|uniref:Uncharacterized protein n=1 Tax=Plakobranchus ocellatus TaxID=259542 RepID=A0AAV3XZ65_9GAST|nr:hypothetical protein PoB_000164700 [Plakobranchus ocellatus]
MFCTRSRTLRCNQTGLAARATHLAQVSAIQVLLQTQVGKMVGANQFVCSPSENVTLCLKRPSYSFCAGRTQGIKENLSRSEQRLEPLTTHMVANWLTR